MATQTRRRGPRPRTTAELQDELATLVGVLIRLGFYEDEAEGFRFLGAILNEDYIEAAEVLRAIVDRQQKGVGNG